MVDETDTQNQTETTEAQSNETEGTGAETQTTETETSILGGESTADTEKTTTEGEGDEAPKAATVPEAYELTPPEGFEKLDEEAVAFATPIFKDIGLTNEQANKLMPVAGDFAQRIITQHNATIMESINATRKEWADAAQADSEIGGAKWGETQELAAKGLDALGFPKGHAFRSALTDSGFGNHPDMIRAMRKVGEMASEDSNFGHTNEGNRKLSTEEKFYGEGYGKPQAEQRS